MRDNEIVSQAGKVHQSIFTQQAYPAAKTSFLTTPRQQKTSVGKENLIVNNTPFFAKLNPISPETDRVEQISRRRL